MDDEPGELLPAKRPANLPDRPERAGWGPGPGPEPSTARAWRIEWRRYVRTPRGAVGFGLLAAALLLWPFAGLSWIPLLIGLGALVVLRLLRFDGLLRGWDIPLAGLVTVIGLMTVTTPWAWALAVSIGVLIAGLLQLPAWRLAVLGLVLCVGAGAGYAFSLVEDEQEQAQQTRVQNEQTIAVAGERVPERVVGALLEGIVQNDPAGVCSLLDERARSQFAAAAAKADCPSAVAAFHAAAAAAPPSYRKLDVGLSQASGSWLVDGCRTAWARPPLGGPALGKVDVRETPRRTYYAAAFMPC